MKNPDFLTKTMALGTLLKGSVLAVALIFSGLSNQAAAQCSADAGTLTGYKPTDCLLSGGTLIGGIPNGDAFVPNGYQTVYVLTEGPGLVIQQAGGTPEFMVTATGSYTVHTLVYDPNTLDLNTVVIGTTTGFDVNALLIQGGGTICASLDVAGTAVLVDNPDAGALTPDASQVCLTSGSATVSATPDGNAYVPVGYNTIYVLTSGAGLVIEDAGASPSFTVNSAGDYTIHTLVYDPDVLDLGIVTIGTTTGFDVNGLLYQGGGNICGALDVAGAPVEVTNCPPTCAVDAGTLSGYKASDCLLTGGTVIGGIPNGNAVVPAGYSTIWVLTEGAGLVIQDVGPDPIFVVNSTGNYTIHTLVYDPNTLDLTSVVIGTTTGFDVNSLLIQGGGTICASLDVTGTSIVVDNPDAGTLSADSAQVCLSNGSATVSATPDANAYVPSGYSTIYVLTEGTGLVIQDAGPNPSFTVSDTGSYTIHTLVYDPTVLNLGIVVIGTTTGFDVNGLLYQGGGNICGALDVAGAPVQVTTCTISCATDAGSLTPDSSQYCLSNGVAMISASMNQLPTVPIGYSLLYVLTEGSGLTIIDVDPTSMFTVTDTGLFTIHTLVYDPNTLDLNSLVIGTTTGFDVNALLVQGGGAICGSLDVGGAPVSVVLCAAPCIADAGSLTADSTSYCIDNSGIFISATPDGNMVVPAGYQTIYVLTQGPDLVLLQANPTPVFSVSDTGSYTIHSLVYDPQTLNLSSITFGTTVAVDVLGLLVQGGGLICASLDVAGAAIDVIDCGFLCTADAGGITAVSSGACIGTSGTVDISATPNGNAVVPVGYQTIYVLTSGSGLVIEQAGANPLFTVSDTGDYIIHTLVYDPNTLDLNTVVLGTTTGFDVNGLLLQGGGTICGSLDVAGAPIMVDLCASGCLANAGTLTADSASFCLINNSATISATAGGNAVVPTGYQTVYVLTEGAGLVISQTASSPSFTVNAIGSYTIHTLVYDPLTLDLTTVTPGVTTGFDVNGLLIQGGGTICASLDVAGAPITVAQCSNTCVADAGTITADQSSYCLDLLTVDISATSDGNAVVPAGYQVAYVLTKGPNLVIQQAGFSPDFTVSDTASYIIHTLVYDPLTLNLSIITPGTTAAVDVLGLLIQGGGTICASLDVAGAPILVKDCPLVTGNPDVESNGLQSEISIWPNPADQQVTIDIQDLPAGVYSVQLVDVKGAAIQLPRNIVVDGSAEAAVLDLSRIELGAYTIMLQSEQHIGIGRLMKSR